MKHLSFVLAFVVTACGANSATAPQVHTSSVERSTFPNYRTFAMGPAADPAPPFDVSDRSFEVERRMRPIVVEELESKGYTEQAGAKKPDFTVVLSSGFAHNDPAPKIDRGPDKSVLRRELVVDAIDTASDTHVWHATAESVVNPKSIDDDLLRRTVHRLFVPFPSQSPTISSNP